MRITPYKGDQPFIFISYAHKDAKLVLPVLARMQADGYRIWMDEGIDPGTEWDEFIAEKLNECSYFIAFLSENYLASSNCKDELNFARDLEKQRLLVYLEDVKLPLGMAMRLNRLQSIFKHRYSDEESFYEKLYHAEGIDVFCDSVEHGTARRKKPEATSVKKASETKKTPSPAKPSFNEEKGVSNDFMRSIEGVSEPLKSELIKTAEDLEDVMTKLRLDGRVVSASVGGVITCFEVRPAPNTKVSQYPRYEADFALSLFATSLRIIAPIPGKGLVGFEIANKTVQVAELRELMRDECYLSSGKTVFCLGRDMSGKTVVSDLARLPHLLIGGTTGSGKTVCLYSILLSLIQKNTPNDLRLLLIDPKRVELSVFDKLPHLLCPVFYETSDALIGLETLMTEMERRYDLISQRSCRDLAGYNQVVPSEDALPRLLVVIDEIADLMIYDRSKTESTVVRLLQKGRAAGIHLIVSTQRPSVDVLTGVLKANIPSRIALRVNSAIDSRLVLDEGGAEKLMMRGDMLFRHPAALGSQRLQAAFVSYEEVQEKVASFDVSEVAYEPAFSALYEKQKALLTQRSLSRAFGESDEKTVTEEKELSLPVMTKAELRLLLETLATQKKVSTSFLQRRFSWGYGKASAVIHYLAANGYLGEYNGRSFPVSFTLNDVEDIMARFVE